VVRGNGSKSLEARVQSLESTVKVATWVAGIAGAVVTGTLLVLVKKIVG